MLTTAFSISPPFSLALGLRLGRCRSAPPRSALLFSFFLFNTGRSPPSACSGVASSSFLSLLHVPSACTLNTVTTTTTTTDIRDDDELLSDFEDYDDYDSDYDGGFDDGAEFPSPPKQTGPAAGSSDDGMDEDEGESAPEVDTSAAADADAQAALEAASEEQLVGRYWTLRERIVMMDAELCHMARTMQDPIWRNMLKSKRDFEFGRWCKVKAKLQQDNINPRDVRFASLWKSVDRALNEDGRLCAVEADSTPEAVAARPSDRSHLCVQAGRLQTTANS